MTKSNANGLKGNVTPKGRSATTRFTRLDYSELVSPGWSAASPNARSLYVELKMMHSGQNNGQIILSVRDAADRMGVSDTHAAVAAFNELVELGFLEMTKAGIFKTKAGKAGDVSHARCWRLTSEAVQDRRGPSNEFIAFDPPALSRARRRMVARQQALKRWQRKLAAVESTTTTPNCDVESTTTPVFTASTLRASVVESTTAILGKPTNCEAEQDCGIPYTYSYPASPGDRVTPSACSRLRQEVIQWRDHHGAGAQRYLARMTGMAESKISRFMSDSRGLRSLTFRQHDLLQKAISPPDLGVSEELPAKPKIRAIRQ